ncbi:signal peptidase II [Silicimonas algicola]|uniref:Lipoprotein signal peptidase n=1 Tax=Silicimonas algicola TaxID=1826607 RepID=A0A316FZI0_9RHOB|nr:signal peptidase II [Silicimonas algicola]AZQ69058.1 signal peptidase II [Silicimonas algicola]PWK54051.1 signal peptidase II [Silicimonas algicola]
MRSLAPLTVTTILIVLADQISKLAVVHVMDLKSLGVIIVADPFLILRMAWNEGINFGFLPFAGKWVLIGLAAAICAWILGWMIRDRPSRIVQISAGLVVGGAIGNVIDRLLYGAVADFLNMSCCGFENPWSFNVADIAIFLGAFGLILFTGDSKKDVQTPRNG